MQVGGAYVVRSDLSVTTSSSSAAAAAAVVDTDEELRERVIR